MPLKTSYYFVLCSSWCYLVLLIIYEAPNYPFKSLKYVEGVAGGGAETDSVLALQHIHCNDGHLKSKLFPTPNPNQL